MLSNYNYGRQNFGEVDWDFPGLANDILKQVSSTISSQYHWLYLTKQLYYVNTYSFGPRCMNYKSDSEFGLMAKK